jgi:glycosyltransferase involved in cell wall biosynthesis
VTLRVLWLSHLVPYPPKGGVLQRSYNLLRETARYHEVTLLAFHQPRLMRLSLGAGDAALATARAALEAFCRRVEVLPIPSEAAEWRRALLLATSYLTADPYTVNWLKSARMGERLAAVLAAQAFDAVQFDTISLAVYRDLVNGPRTVLTHHNVESHMMLRRAEHETSALKRHYLRREGRRLAAYERRMCGRFDVNVTCSALDSERLAEVAPGVRTVEVPNGVDLDYFHPDGGPETPGRLVFAGRLSAYANRRAARYLVEEIWPRARVRLPGATLDIVGAAPPPEAVALARDEPRVRVPGFVDDVRPYLDRAEVYVCPITDGGGTKLKVLDALAMGKAMVAHPVACEGIEVKDGESVLLATTPEAFVAHIAGLLADPARRRAIGAAGRRLVEERYSYASIGRRMADVLAGTL